MNWLKIKYLFLLVASLIVGFVVWNLDKKAAKVSKDFTQQIGLLDNPSISSIREHTAGSATGVNLSHYDGTVLRWRFNAPHVIQQKAAERSEIRDPAEIWADEPNLTLYRENSTTLQTLACQSRLNQQTREFSFIDHVVVMDEEGHLLFTNLLRFDANKQQLYTDQPVVLEGKNSRLTGKGLEIDMALRTLRVLDQVRIVSPEGWKGLW